MTEVPQQCPKCGTALERRPNMFHFRGQSFAGWVCGTCNALWEDENDNIFKHAAALAEMRTTAGANYVLLEDGGLRCLLCGTASHNPHDGAQRYCGRCHTFLEDVPLHG